MRSYSGSEPTVTKVERQNLATHRERGSHLVDVETQTQLTAPLQLCVYIGLSNAFGKGNWAAILADENLGVEQ